MTRLNEFGQSIGDALAPNWQRPSHPPKRPIDGTRVRVEPLEPDRHAADLYEANGLDVSGEGWTYLNYGPFESLKDYRAWMEVECLGDDPLFWSYVDLSTGRSVGLGSYLRINPKDGVIEVGHLRYSPKLQRTPLATEAMYLMMKNAFDLGYRRYEWKCDALNAPSRRAAERYGFIFEGIFRQATHYKGRNRDTSWFSITDQDWPGVKEAHERWLDPANFDEHGIQRTTLSDFIKQSRA